MSGIPPIEIQVPRRLLGMSESRRAQALMALTKALGLESSIREAASDTARNFVTDYNDQMQRKKSMWHPHENEAIADLEDAVYHEMAVSLWNKMLDVFDALGLDYPTADGLQKALDTGDEYECMHIKAGLQIAENELIKSDDGKPYKDMDDVNRMYGGTPRDPQGQKSRRTASAPYQGDGKSFTDKQLQTLDSVLSRYGVPTSALIERIAVSGAYLGQLLSAFEGRNEELRRNIVNLLPVTLEDRKELNAYALTEKEAEKFNLPLLPLQDQEINAIEWAKQHAADKIGEIDERTKQQIRALIVNARKNRVTPQQLETLLFDKFGDINRDLRRIALTEVAEATNNGYLMTLPHMQAVTILGADNACEFCHGMQGLELMFVHPDKLPKDTGLDWSRMVWVGKSNYGRKRAAWEPCCPAHPHCRDRYVRYNPKFQRPDKEQRRIVIKNREQIIGDALKAKLEREQDAKTAENNEEETT